MSALNTLVSEAVDFVVHCSRTADGPRVTEILAVEELAAGVEATQFTTTPVFNRPDPSGPLVWTGQVPTRLAALFARSGEDLHTLVEDWNAAMAAQR
jgi:hypothetical protein